MNLNRILFLVCGFAISAYAECVVSSEFYSTDSLQEELATLKKEFEKCKEPVKDSISTLQKEIATLEEKIKKCEIEYDTKNCHGNLGSVSLKNKECWAFNINVGKYYNSPDTTIGIKLILDGNCNELRFFSIEDKKTKTRKDSTAYSDGNWEIFEMKGETEVSSKNSVGASTLSIWDSEGRLQEQKLNSKDGNLINHDRYFWKDGLLVKVVGLDGTRNYYYGKNPYEDTVKVVPSDKGHNFHRGYDGTVGKIPKKGDKNYKYYLRHPYGSWVN